MSARTVIFDVDGTLCDTRSLHHLLGAGAGKDRNFTAFHTASAHARPNWPVVAALHTIRRHGDRALVVTGRAGRWYDLTSRWLDRWGITHDGLITRRDGDPRADTIVKSEILENVGRDHDVIGAWDDRPRVIKMWHEAGLPVTIIRGWHDDTDQRLPPPLLHIPVNHPLPVDYRNGADDE